MQLAITLIAGFLAIVGFYWAFLEKKKTKQILT
jgi:nitrogen fixation-related uncharacterized protein